MDRFHLIGDVYAGSGDCSCGGGGGAGCDNCAGKCGPDNSSCRCACSSAPQSEQQVFAEGGEFINIDVGIGNCASNSNCQRDCVGGCQCNSAGGACNSGSGGGSGNSGSGNCNSGG